MAQTAKVKNKINAKDDVGSLPVRTTKSYEDDFEKGLELSGSFQDDKISDMQMHSSAEDYYTDEDDGGGVLDYGNYGDCDTDLETLLETALTTTGEHDEDFEDDPSPARSAAKALSSEVERRPDGESKARRIVELFKKIQLKTRSLGSLDNFFDAAEEVGYDSTPDSGVHENFQNMDSEQRARQEEEWRTELARIEDEIQTLRQVLSAKVKQSQDLKRKLGISAWKEFVDDMGQGIKNVKESNVYQKTEEALKTATDKTTELFGSFGTSVKRGIGDVRSSSTYRSFEDKVGAAYTNVKDKVSNSRSSSVQNFEEALAATEGRKSGSSATTPSIPEEKPLI